MREQLKFTGMLLLAGAGLGLLASMFWGPGLIEWWWTPPGNAGTLNNLCGSQVREAAQALVRMQLFTGLGLGIAAAVGGHLIRRRRAEAAAGTPPVQTPPAPTPPAPPG